MDQDPHSDLINMLFGFPPLPQILDPVPAPAPTAPSPTAPSPTYINTASQTDPTHRDAFTQVRSWRSQASSNPYSRFTDESHRFVNQLLHKGELDDFSHRDFQDAVEGVVADRMDIEHPDVDDEITSHLQDRVLPALQNQESTNVLHRPTPMRANYASTPAQAPRQNTEDPEIGGESSNFSTTN